MAAPISLASICDALVKAVRADLDLTFDARVTATIGNPEQVDAIDPRTDHYLNFFFYQFEPYAFDSDTLPGEPLLLRTRCLITPFAIQESEEAGAGYNDLKLLGEVMRIFHQTPVRSFTVLDSEEQPIDYQVQTVFHALGPEQINNLWTTQGGSVAYHPSVAYELALTPVLPSEKSVDSPLVGAVGFDVRGRMDRRVAHSGVFHTPLVTARRVDTGTEDWAPAICLVHDGQCLESLSLPLGSAELAAFAPVVWVAGEPGSTVRLVWEAWRSTVGWFTLDTTSNLSIQTDRIDPDDIDPAALSTLGVPDVAGESLFAQHGQVVLSASRSYLRANDQAELTVRSNPLLVSIYQPSSPP